MLQGYDVCFTFCGCRSCVFSSYAKLLRDVRDVAFPPFDSAPPRHLGGGSRVQANPRLDRLTKCSIERCSDDWDNSPSGNETGDVSVEGYSNSPEVCRTEIGSVGCVHVMLDPCRVCVQANICPRYERKVRMVLQCLWLWVCLLGSTCSAVLGLRPRVLKYIYHFSCVPAFFSSSPHLSHLCPTLDLCYACICEGAQLIARREVPRFSRTWLGEDYRSDLHSSAVDHCHTRYALQFLAMCGPVPTQADQERYIEDGKLSDQ